MAEAEAEMQGKSRCDAEPPLPFTLSHSCECAHSLWHVFCGFCPAAAAASAAAAVSLLGQHQQLDSSGFQQSSSCLGRQRIERTNAKCVGDDSFSWVIASARLCDACRLLVFLLLLLRVCVCVCVLVLLLSLNLLTVAAAAAVALYLPLLFVCLFICLLLLLNFVIIIIVGFLGKTRTHIVSEHDANDTFPQKHKQKQRQKQLQ